MEQIFEIAQWVITGVLSPVVLWLVHRQAREVRTKKEIHDTYKQMYEDVSKALIQTRNDNEKIFEKLGKLEQAVSMAASCPHYAICPVTAKLQKHKDGTGVSGGRKPAANRQHESDRGAIDEGDPGTGLAGGTGAID